jgi:hypothetical protein
MTSHERHRLQQNSPSEYVSCSVYNIQAIMVKIYNEVYTPAILPHWTDFPCADTYVHAEEELAAAGSVSSFQGLQLRWQL